MSDIRIIRAFYSYPERTARTLRIYTPDACSSEPERHLPVLYMLDGQNVFGRSGVGPLSYMVREHDHGPARHGRSNPALDHRCRRSPA